MSEAFHALVKLGFRQGDSRAALNQVRAHVGANGVESAASAVMLALRCLRGGGG
jgi:Holliday junction resolvasome RuvABC DNA-binding subunit